VTWPGWTIVSECYGLVSPAMWNSGVIQRTVLDMRRTTLCAIGTIAFLALVVLTVTAQTERQIELRYPRLYVFAVRPNMTLTAKYSVSDGQVCEMVLEPRHWDGEKFLLMPTLSEEDTISVVEEVVPLSERGNRTKNEFDRLAAVSGGSFSRTYDYEKITVQVAGSTGEKGSGITAALVRWRNRPCSSSTTIR
jgi:hypothetical protein